MATITLIEGHKSRVFKLEDSTSIGRDKDNVIVLSGPGVARRHADIERTLEGEYRILDRLSLGGTFVDGIRITARVLRDGDRLTIGEHVMFFSKHERLITADITLSDEDEPYGQQWFSIDELLTYPPADLLEPSALARSYEKLRLFFELAQTIGVATEVDPLLAKILDVTIRSLGAERGAILLVDASTGEMTARVGRRASGREALVLSKTIIDEVVARRSGVITVDARSDPRFALSKSVELGRIRSAISVPILHQGDLLGIIHLDSPKTGLFDQKDLELLSSVALQAGIAIKNAIFTERIRELQALERERERASAQQEQLASVGRLAASVAHEINNPLTYVLTNMTYAAAELKNLQSKRPDVDLQAPIEALEEAAEGADRVHQVIRDLRALSRVSDSSGPIDIGKVIDTSINVARGEIRHRARLLRDYQHKGLVQANAARLGQVFLNILVNAAQALPTEDPETQEIRVRTYNDTAGSVVVEISDTGPGIPEAIRAHIFDPFFTTKEEGEGTGLGLFVSRNIVTSYGGNIELSSGAAGGTTFRISFPSTLAIDTEDLVFNSTIAVHPAAQPRLRILIVDDDPKILNSLGRVLAEHEVRSADHVGAGLDLLGRQPFDVVFCDILMPGLTGIDFYNKVQTSWPGREHSIVFITGATLGMSPEIEQFVRSIPNLCLLKPFQPEQIKNAIKTSVRVPRS